MTEPEAPSIPPLVLDWTQYYRHQDGIPQHVLDQRMQAAKDYVAQLRASQAQLQVQGPTLEDARKLYEQALDRARGDVEKAAQLLQAWRQQEREAKILDVGARYLLVQELSRIAAKTKPRSAK